MSPSKRRASARVRPRPVPSKRQRPKGYVILYENELRQVAGHSPEGEELATLARDVAQLVKAVALRKPTQEDHHGR